MNELDNNISADEEVETFEHVPNEVLSLLSDFFYELKVKKEKLYNLKANAKLARQKLVTNKNVEESTTEIVADKNEEEPDSKFQEQKEINCLNEALAFLVLHPKVPEKDTCVNFKLDDTSFSIIYTGYKIELSDYLSEHGDWGSDHYQRFNFRYEIEGYSEQEGDLDEFRALLFECLNEVKVTDISISEEE
jgi:hypothetical protein